jgi:ferredoxin
MLTVYFSGTGNSKYLAERFSGIMAADCCSVEEAADFDALFAAHGQIAFFYPVYGSYVPRIMREFVLAHKQSLANKQLMIFCTQLLFSGDGARVFTELLPGLDYDVIYAEHFRMPDNIANFALFKVKNNDEIKPILDKANQKLAKVCENIKKGVVVKRGFNPASRFLGLWLQRKYYGPIERKAEKDVRISTACILCGECVAACPMGNLTIEDQKVVPHDNCTLCCRCVNLCPVSAITVLLHGKIKKQYKGVPGN